MKLSLFAACALASLLLLSSLGSSRVSAAAQDPVPAPQTAPAQDLVQRVAVLEKRAQELEAAHRADTARLDEVLRYLEIQRTTGRTMVASIDQVKELGFTKGINFHSREVLLDTLRAQAKALEAPLPKAPARKKK